MACTHGRQPVVFPVSRIAAGFPDHPGNDRIIFRLDLGRIPFSALHSAGMYDYQGQENGKPAVLFRSDRSGRCQSGLSFLCSNGRYSHCAGRVIMNLINKSTLPPVNSSVHDASLCL